LAGPTDLPSVAVAVSRDLTRAGIAHALSGALAMAAHGYVRATADVDILVVTSSLRIPEVFEIVRRQGFAGEDRDLISSLRERYVATLRAGTKSVEILVPVLPYHGTILSRSRLLDIDGVPVPVVSLEDLVVLKMLWHRTKDVADVEALVAIPASLDQAWIETTLRGMLPEGDPRFVEIQGLFRRLRGRDRS
jgi:hypothetical protein